MKFGTSDCDERCAHKCCCCDWVECHPSLEKQINRYIFSHWFFCDDEVVVWEFSWSFICVLYFSFCRRVVWLTFSVRINTFNCVYCDAWVFRICELPCCDAHELRIKSEPCSLLVWWDRESISNGSSILNWFAVFVCKHVVACDGNIIWILSSWFPGVKAFLDYKGVDFSWKGIFLAATVWGLRAALICVLVSSTPVGVINDTG